MSLLSRMIGCFLLVSVFTTSLPAKSYAVGMKVVFQDALWGSALGALLGLAVWGLRDNEEDELERFLVRGASFGIIAGMAYGFYETERMGNGFIQNETPESSAIVQWNSQDEVIEIRPVALIPSYRIHDGQHHSEITLARWNF